MVPGVRGSMAREWTSVLVRPVFTAVQWSPPSIERKTPAPQVPAYKVVGVFGSMARQETCDLARPVFTRVQYSPLLVERNTPYLAPAYRVVAVSYTHLRAHETRHDLVCRLLLEKK